MPCTYFDSNMYKTRRELGNTDLSLGQCLSVDNNTIGQQIFKNVNAETEQKNSIHYDHRQVRAQQSYSVNFYA